MSAAEKLAPDFVACSEDGPGQDLIKVVLSVPSFGAGLAVWLILRLVGPHALRRAHCLKCFPGPM